MPGSENYGTAAGNMAKQHEDDWADRARGASIDRTPSPDEATTLLGADASDSEPGVEPQIRRDSWIGDKEYAHLPWYRKPHVRFGTREACERVSRSPY